MTKTKTDTTYAIVWKPDNEDSSNDAYWVQTKDHPEDEFVVPNFRSLNEAHLYLEGLAEQGYETDRYRYYQHRDGSPNWESPIPMRSSDLDWTP